MTSSRSDIDQEYRLIEPKLRRIEKDIRYSGLSIEQQAALMTMAAARIMSTAGAMMAAVSDAKHGRPFNASDHNIAEWTELTAKEVARIVASGALN